MSGETGSPRSSSNNLTSDFLNPSEDSTKKNETSNIVETNESLHLGSDLLAEKLDYEIDEEPDELEEQEDVDLSILDSPTNEKDESQDVDSYHIESKTDGHLTSYLPGQDAKDDVIEYSAANTTDKSEENKENSNTSGVASNDAQNGNDNSADIGLGTNSDDKSDESASKEANDKSNNDGKSTEIEVDEELEEGEVSDEDEEARKERLKPQPVCRFYSKGACTWGSSCRFIHPGVLDTGR